MNKNKIIDFDGEQYYAYTFEEIKNLPKGFELFVVWPKASFSEGVVLSYKANESQDWGASIGSDTTGELLFVSADIDNPESQWLVFSEETKIIKKKKVPTIMKIKDRIKFV